MYHTISIKFFISVTFSHAHKILQAPPSASHQFIVVHQIAHIVDGNVTDLKNVLMEKMKTIVLCMITQCPKSSQLILLVNKFYLLYFKVM